MRSKRSIFLTLLTFLIIFLCLLTSNVYATENSSQGYVYLSDIPYITNQSSVGWGSITLDSNLEPAYNGGLITLIVDGQKKQFYKGIAAHATSTLVYDIRNYDYDYFTTYVGVDESKGNNGNGVKFIIYTSVDGENWDVRTEASPQVMKGTSNALFYKIDIKEANYIKLYAHNNGNATADHAVYADARLIKEGYEETEDGKVDFIKTVEEYDAIIKSHYGEEITGEYELALLQREFVKNVGYDYLQFLVGYRDDCKETVKWLFNDIDLLRQYILGGAPSGGNYGKALVILSELYTEYSDDFKNKELLNNPTNPNMTYGDLYVKMAMSISLTHSQIVGLWMQSGIDENKSQPLRRYAIYKYIHNTGGMRISESMDMTHVFEDLHIQEMRLVVYNNIDDEEILWLNRYTQDNIDANPNNVWRYQTPHPYIAYVWPNYGNPVYFAEENVDYFNQLFSVNKTNNNVGTELVNENGEKTGKIGLFDSEFVIPGGKNTSEYRLKVTRSTTENRVCKLWFNFRNKFGTGCVCGGISKSGANIRGVHGIPAMVIGQPGHAALLFYSKDTEGRGFWRIDNDVSGWTLSGGGGRLLGWGNGSYTQGFSNGVYVELEQAAINDYQNLIKAQKLVMLAKVYEGDFTKQEEICRKALETQSINFDAWLGLINAYKANDAKTENEFYALAEEVAENLKYYPLPMTNAINLIKPKLTSVESAYQFALLQERTLGKAKNLPNNTADSFTIMQPGVARLEANYILGQIDNTIATFSFDGEDANKIVLASRFDGSGVRWDYCIDGNPQGGTEHWHEVSFDANEEHKLLLTPEEIASITAENDIYVHIVGVNYNEENLYKIDIKESAGLPATLYANDWENKLIAAIPTMMWKLNENDPWTLYKDAEPDLSGDKTVTVKVAATGTYLESKTEVKYNFTTNTDPDTRKYIPIDHLSVHAFSTEASGQGRYATNAIDGNLNTNWHSNWSGNDPDKFIVIKLDEIKNITALEYFPVGGGNGKIESAQILVSLDGEEWTEVVSGTNWTYANASDVTPKVIDFDPVKAQYIKIVGKKTQNSFITARMFNFYENTTVRIVGTFSFSGDNAKKIIIDNDFKGQNWQYSLDGGATWKNGSGDEHLLTDAEVNQITSENQIKMKFDGNATQYTIKISKMDPPTVTAYLNDWENRLIGVTNKNGLEWQIEGTNTWTDYAVEDPVVAGAKKLYIRAKANLNSTASDPIEYQFAEDGNTPKETYVPISHLSVHEYTSQSIDSKRPYYAQNVIDGNPDTMWHTDFRYALPGNKASYTIKLDSNKYISALEYKQIGYTDRDPVYSRNIRVYVGDNGTDWIEAGKLENIPQNSELRKIVFDESVSGQYVKIEMDGYGIFAALSMVNLYEDTTVKKVGSFSFDGEEAHKIILVDEFKGSNWEYSLDGGTTWKRGTGDAQTLTQEEVNKVNGDNKIKVKINNIEYVINIQKSITPVITAYPNDLENRLIGMTDIDVLEWKIENNRRSNTGWTDYVEKEPVVEGDAKLLIRKKARGVFAPSDIVEFEFTADNQTETRKYIPVSHLSIAGVSAEDKAQNGAAANAIDGNYNTRWLNSSAGTDTEKYIIVKLDSAMYLSAMDYVPHGENGKILSGKIEGSMDGENFTEIAQISGWANNTDTKTIDFAEPVKVRYVKITGVETSYTSAKRHVGARMFNFYEDTTKKEVVIPTAEVEYSTTNKTNKDVVATLVRPSTNITVLNNNGSTEYTFTENGSFTFEFEDAEGNKGKAEAKVDWICKTLPEAILEYDIPTPTNKDVTVTVKFKVNGEFSDEVTILNEDRKNTHTFTENGSYTFKFRGPYGNEGEATAKVDWIHKTLPEAIFEYSTKETTNKPVTVTVKFKVKGEFNDKVTILNNDGNNTYTFNKNGEFTFEFRGPYGNEGMATAKVDWIDTTIPTATVSYDITTKTNKNVVATLDKGDQNLTILNEDRKDTHTFTENGEYTFKFRNELGNEGEVTAKVDWIDKKVPNGNISYNITQATNQPVIATIRFDKENVTITNNDGKNTYTFTENKEFTFEFVDDAGNEGEATATVDWIDKTLPVATITYSTEKPTNKDVVATIDFDKEGVTVKGGNTHTFTQNGEYEFEFTGPAGNSGVAKAVVNWIDKVVPEPLLVYSTMSLTNEDVTATVVFEDEKEGEVSITNNGGKNSHVFDENGTFTFEFSDRAGNKGKVTATVSCIDKVAPRAEVEYDVRELTNGNVVATLVNESEEITITNNDGKDTYTFTENGEFTFEFRDIAGNTGTAKADVDWIDRVLPIATVKYSTRELTNKDVIATIEFNKTDVTVAGGNTHTFTQNGEYTFEYVDSAGNTGMKTVTVNWIDKVAPTATVEYDVKTATNGNVVATLANNSEDIIITNNDGKATYTFTDNNEFTFEFRDLAGNTGTATAAVNWIDKVAPTAAVEYDVKTTTNGNVVATLVNKSEDIIVTNNDGKDTYTFTKNGTFTFEFKDKAGNTGTATATVNWIEEKEPVIERSFELILKADKATANPGDTVKIQLEVSKLKNVEQGLMAMLGQFEYDKNVLELVKIEGAQGWSFDKDSLNADNLKFVTDAGNYVKSGDVITVTVKVKANATVGTTGFKVKNVEASDGSNSIKAKDANITINIEKKDEPTPPTPDEFKISSDKYDIKDGNIAYVLPSTTVSEFYKHITTNRTTHVMAKDGTEVKGDNLVKTGMKLTVDNENVEYTIIVLGDASEDGIMDIIDLAKIKLHLIDKQKLTGIYAIAVDVDKDGEITINDLAAMKLSLIGLKRFE